tara:strand:- start:617 stop:1081 length:465 start_codon:yes stop_codon:yes gene_type:complete
MWIKESKKDDIDYIASNMRKADRDEVWASDRCTPLEALTISYGMSKPCFTGMDGQTPVAMFGVVPLLENIGSIWLLGTDVISDSKPISFLRWSKKFFPTLTKSYDMVCNRVDGRNKVHIKWIKWLGFTFINEVNHGPDQLPFYEFARLIKCVDQ